MSNNFYNDSTNTNIIPIIRVGEVKSITDDTKSGRIQVKITGIDDNESDKSLIQCVPLMPKFLTLLPKVGEMVFVFQYEHQDSSATNSFKTKRFWFGPLITQPTKLEGETYNSAFSILPDGYTKLKDPNVDIGSYGDTEDIVLQGRYNTDIIQKDRQIWLRVGKTIEGDTKKFNDKNLGYIQLKYGGERLKRNVVDREIVTFVTPAVERIITATMNTITTDGTILKGDLPKSSYFGANIDRTELFITITNAKTGSIITSLENENINGENSRNIALEQAKTFIDINRGNRWKLRSKANDLVEGIYKGSNGIALFNSTPIEVKKTIKEVELEKGKNESTSVINFVANKLNLISYDGEHNFNLTDPKGLISDEEQEIINKEAHPLVYGDILIEFLNLMKKYVSAHVHPYHGLPADPSTITTDVLRFDLNTILNKNINSN